MLYSLARTSGPNVLFVLATKAVSGLEGEREVPEVCKWTSRSLADSCYCDKSNLCCMKLSENSEVKIALWRSIAKLHLALRWILASGGWWRLQKHFSGDMRGGWESNSPAAST